MHFLHAFPANLFARNVTCHCCGHTEMRLEKKITILLPPMKSNKTQNQITAGERNIKRISPSDGVRIVICWDCKFTIMQPDVNGICHCQNSPLIHLHNFIDSAQATLMVSILFPISITQGKFRQKRIIDSSDF